MLKNKKILSTFNNGIDNRKSTHKTNKMSIINASYATVICELLFLLMHSARDAVGDKDVGETHTDYWNYS